MLMLAWLVPGAVLPLRMIGASGAVGALAVRAPDGSLRIGLINKDLTRGVRVTVDAGRAVATASILRLAGPSAEATSAITLGGAGVDEFGAWTPPEKKVALTGRAISIELPSASAALVIMNP